MSARSRLAIGVNADTGHHYVSFPVSNQMLDYLEYYEITPEQYRVFMADHAAALEFVESCRRHERDDLLFYKPGRDRGIPT